MNALTAHAPRGLTWAVLLLHRSALLVAAGLLTAGAAARTATARQPDHQCQVTTSAAT